jgi:phosphoribosylformylglycinamidine synthase subunit PurL
VIEGLQDMGAAGLTCSSCEMGSRGGLGVRIELDKVPARAAGLTPYELDAVGIAGADAGGLRAGGPGAGRGDSGEMGPEGARVGEVTAGGKLTVTRGGEVVAELPNSLLTDAAPIYDLPRSAAGLS